MIDHYERELERERLALVFCRCQSEVEISTEGEFRGGFVCDDQPEWLSESDKCEDPDAITLLQNGIYTFPRLPVGWVEHSHHMTSGERECFCATDDGPDPDCELCEGDGLVYLGEGWAERIVRPIRVHLPAELLDEEGEPLNFAFHAARYDSGRWLESACDGAIEEPKWEDPRYWLASVPDLVKAFIATGVDGGDVGIFPCASSEVCSAVYRLLTETAGIDAGELVVAAERYGADWRSWEEDPTEWDSEPEAGDYMGEISAPDSREGGAQ